MLRVVVILMEFRFIKIIIFIIIFIILKTKYINTCYTK